MSGAQLSSQKREGHNNLSCSMFHTRSSTRHKFIKRSSLSGGPRTKINETLHLEFSTEWPNEGKSVINDGSKTIDARPDATLKRNGNCSETGEVMTVLIMEREHVRVRVEVV
jgi:hypothetical protein